MFYVLDSILLSKLPPKLNCKRQNVTPVAQTCYPSRFSTLCIPSGGATFNIGTAQIIRLIFIILPVNLNCILIHPTSIYSLCLCCSPDPVVPALCQCHRVSTLWHTRSLNCPFQLVDIVLSVITPSTIIHAFAPACIRRHNSVSEPPCSDTIPPRYTKSTCSISFPIQPSAYTISFVLIFC